MSSTKKPPAKNLTVVKTPSIRRNKECVELLERMLADAKAGNVQGLAIVWILPDRSVGTASTETGAVHTLLGGLDILKHRIISGLPPREPIE